MANTFTYAAMLAKWKQALIDRSVEAFFTSANENGMKMRIEYTKLGNVQQFTEWLQYMADLESQNMSAGAVLTTRGGI